MPKIRYLMISIAFLFYLSGCGAPSGGNDSGGSAVSVVPTGNGTALVSWIPPTENTDGSPLSDLSGYKIYYGTSSGSYSEVITIDSPGLTSYLVEDLGASEWYFSMTAFNASRIESANSLEVSKLIE